MLWPNLINDKRFGLEHLHDTKSGGSRTDFRRDYDRLVFSSPFRRLQNKTQVFPLPGSVFVHNRLTHSLEVSCVGRSMADSISQRLRVKYADQPWTNIFYHLGDIVSAACLAHDLGNPPFGHSGEKAISTFFSEGEGRALQPLLEPIQWTDLTNFEGNANALRALTHQFRGRRQGGFAMTYSTLASIVKYPHDSSLAGDKGKFGFFDTERQTYLRIADELGIRRLESPEGTLLFARHPLVYIVEAADDICYEVMDIEDAYKLRLLSPEETRQLFLAFFEVAERENLLSAYPDATDESDRIAYLRSCVINALERACVQTFLDHEEEILEGRFRGSLIDHLPDHLLQAYRHCEDVARRRIYSCREVLDVDLAGYRIIYTLLELMMDAVLEPKRAYSELLLAQVSSQYQLSAPHLYDRVMAVLDYLSGMTDVYALDLYRKINGHSLPGV